MSERERFVLKFATILERLDLLPSHKCAYFYASVFYGDGKGVQTKSPGFSDMLRELYQQYEKEYDAEFAPWSVSKSFQMAAEKAEEAAESVPHTAYGNWCRIQMRRGTPGATTAAPTTASAVRPAIIATPASAAQAAIPTYTASSSRDSVFSQSGGPFDLPLGAAGPGGPPVYYTGNRALITIAPPESGKSLAQAVPALLHYAGPVFVLDIKGECYARTASERARRFGSKVVKFNPFDPDTARYNPLSFISDDFDACWGDASLCAQMMVPVRNERDQYWELTAQRMLALYIAYVVLTETKPERRNMQQVLDLVAGLGTDAALDVMSSPDTPFPRAMTRTALTIRELRDPKSRAQLTGVVHALEQNMLAWQDPKTDRATSANDWTPMDFRRDPPLSVYVTIPPGSLAYHGPLLRVMVAQHVAQLTSVEASADAKPVVFMLDEFPQLGRMDVMRQALDVGRSYRLKPWLFAQSAQQLETTYGDVGKAMIETSGVRMFMNPVLRDAETISKEFGSSESLMTEKKEQVLPPDHIMSAEHRNSVFVLTGNERLVLSKNFAARP